MNSTTYQMAHWKGVWRFHFFNLKNDLSAHHCYGFPLKRTKKNLRWFHLFLFSNVLIFFLSATVTCCGQCSRFFSLLFGLDNRVNSLLSKRRGNFLGSKVLFVLTHAGLCELFAVTRVFLHVLSKWKSSHACLQPAGLWRGFNLSIFFIKEFSVECNTEETQEANCSSNQQTFLSE